MERILLLEAAYKNKFPPLGLMKIAQYHREKGDLVFFSKGEVKPLSEQVCTQICSAQFYQERYGDSLQDHMQALSAAIEDGRWDRVYVTTLFTFEWKRTVALIQYAKTLVGHPSQVYVGGIASSLMPEEYEATTGIRPVVGLLNSAQQIGYADDACIDELIPDYSILEHTEYRYPFEDGYFLSATRGCGMRCSFCAVQTLEPDYMPYLPIVPRIEEIEKLYGRKRNLYLMDNNVLKSDHFPQIVEDIKLAGFARGATMENLKTGKQIKRHIDFNQGLDMNFLTEKNVQLLSTIALSPCHVAFDHIDDRAKFVKALALLEQYDITNICSYLLYNTPDFSGKGMPRRADTPEDMYRRMATSLEFSQSVNGARRSAGKSPFAPFSFPMRYAPLMTKDRIFIGDNWNRKLVIGLGNLCGRTNGGFFPNENTRRMVGQTFEEFYEKLLLPTQYIKSCVLDETKLKYDDTRYYLSLAKANWTSLFRNLTPGERTEFESLIADNLFTFDKLPTMSRKVRKLYYHYFHGSRIVALIKYGTGIGLGREILDFYRKECPFIVAANQNHQEISSTLNQYFYVLFPQISTSNALHMSALGVS